MQCLRKPWLVMVLVTLLTACGGGDDSDGGNPPFSRLVAFGDSLSDVGTYGVGTIAMIGAQTGGAGRWTVNAPTGGQIWVEQLSEKLGLPTACPAETGLLPNGPGLTGAPVTTHAGCTVYAQGSARVSSPLAGNSVGLQALGQVNMGLMAKPVKDQMAAHLAATGGYTGTELVVVMAGANDVLMELQLTAPTSQAQALANTQAAGAELGALVQSQVLAKGAQRVLVMNLPAIADSPYVRALSPDAPALVDTLTRAFNAQLAQSLRGVPGVVLADVHGLVSDQMANPARYGLTNVTDVACGPNAFSGPGANGSSVVCNASNLLAGDRSRYLFADGVHPTPYAHRLFSDFAVNQMRDAGWDDGPATNRQTSA